MRAETAHTVVQTILEKDQFMMGKHRKFEKINPAFHHKLVIFEGLESRRGSKKMRLDLLRPLEITMCSRISF